MINNDSCNKWIPKIKSELEEELHKIIDKEEINSIHYKIIANKSGSHGRPVRGRKYQHIKSRFKCSKSRTKEEAKSTINFGKYFIAKRIRPSSACSSPTKIGNPYKDMNDSFSDCNNSKFIR